MNLKLTDSQNQKIVDAILGGLKMYLAERHEKRNSMIVSGAYAWTKSNHIETQLARELTSIEINYELKRISSWEYVQFFIGDEKIIFLVKSPSFVKSFQEKGQKNQKHYLREFSKNNDRLLESKEIQNRIKRKQLSLPFDELPTTENVIMDNVDRSYIIVYEVDSNGMIDSIVSYLPHTNGKLYQVDDLSKYIPTSGVEITADELLIAKETFATDLEYEANTVLDFEIVGEENENISSVG